MTNRPDLYKSSCDKLFKAYFDNTLKHGDCRAYAVGNILESGDWKCLFLTATDIFGRHKTEDATKEDMYMVWKSSIFTRGPEAVSIYRLIIAGREDLIETAEEMKREARELINASGYTVEELMRIERTFEVADKGTSAEDHMYNGLVAVLDVLKDIHQVEDDHLEKTRFKAHHELKVKELV